MSLQTIRQSDDSLTVRYFPLLPWLFIAVALYGLGTIVAALAAGSQPGDGGTLLAIALLAGLTAFVAVAGGQVSTARFDRRADTVQLRRYGLLGRSSQERRLSEVVGLRVKVLRRSQHRVELQLRSGERLPLTSHYVVTFTDGGVQRMGEYLGIAPEIVTAKEAARQPPGRR